MNAEEPVDSRLLQTFDAVVRHGSVTRAAQELGRSQPAVSHRLRALERDLGVRLFERQGQTLRLTEYGRRLHEVCADLMVRTQRLRDLLLDPDELEGEVTVGTLGALGSYLLAGPLAEVIREHPRIQLDLRFGLLEQHLSDLRGGRLDFAVFAGGPAARGLTFEAIGATEMLLAVPSDSPLGRPDRVERVSADAVRAAGHRYLAYGATADPVFEALEGGMRGAGLIDEWTPRVPRIESLRRLVAAGAGCTFLPHYVTELDAVDGRMRAVRVEGLEVSVPIHLAVRSSAVGTPVLDVVESALRRIDLG